MRLTERVTRHARLTLTNYQRLPSPPFLVLFINSICNMKCDHCFYWTALNQKNDLTKDELFALSLSLGKIENLNLSGGEPFLRPEFGEICRQFIQHNGVKEIYVPTNGYFTARTIAAITEVLARPHDPAKVLPDAADMRRRLKGDYQEVQAPQLLDKSLWETSGHWGWYADNMFAVKSATAFINPKDETADQKVFALKPMNCPGHVQVFNQGLHSYRDLPIRYGEFGACHRNEPSGALHGIMRVRAFTQDDGHIFCMPGHIRSECTDFNRIALAVYRDFGFTDVAIKICLLYTSPSPRDRTRSRMPSSA